MVPWLCSGFVDRDILDGLPRQDARVEFLHHAVEDLRRKLDGRLHVEHGRPRDVFARLLTEHKISLVYANEDYEPYARERDVDVAELLKKHGAEFRAGKDQVIFGPEEVLKDDRTPYQVYGAYARKWRARLQENPPSIRDTRKLVRAFLQEPVPERADLA